MVDILPGLNNYKTPSYWYYMKLLFLFYLKRFQQKLIAECEKMLTINLRTSWLFLKALHTSIIHLLANLSCSSETVNHVYTNLGILKVTPTKECHNDCELYFVVKTHLRTKFIGRFWGEWRKLSYGMTS